MSRSRELGSLSIAAFLAATAMLLLPTAARSVDYSVLSCNGFPQVPGSVDFNWIQDGGGSIAGEADCPDELRIEVLEIEGDYVGEGQYGGVMQWGTTPPVKHIRFIASGGDTSGRVQYEVVDCSFCDSAPSHQFLGTEPGDPQREVTMDFNDEPLAEVRIRAKCVAAQCPPSPPLLIRDVEMVTSDETPPVMGPIFDEPGGSVQWGYYWVNPERLKAAWSVRDDETGVADATVRIDGEVRWSGNNPDCEGGASMQFTRFRPCGGGIASDRPFVYDDLSGLREGSLPVQIDAHNGVGMPMEQFNSTIHLDGTNPDPPDDVHVNTPIGPGGWHYEPNVGLGWTVPEDGGPDADNAPLSHSTIDLDPLTPGLPNPDPVEWEWLYGAPDLALPAEGLWRVRVAIVDEAGNTSTRERVDVGFDRDPPDPPTLDEHNWVSLATLIEGYEQTWTAPQVAAGDAPVCGYHFAVDDDPFGDAVAGKLLPATESAWDIRPRIGAGRHYVHVSAQSCNGLESAAATTPIDVDGKAPTVQVAGLPQSGWSAGPLTASINAIDDRSGVESITYAIDDEDAVTTPASSISISIPEGAHVVHVWAADKSGNVSEPRDLRVDVDATVPSLEFDPHDPGDPLTIGTTVTDRGSGVASAWVEIRRIDPGAGPGESGWRQIGGEALPPVPGPASLHFERQVDDTQMTAGLWEVRAMAIDLAGNIASGGTVKPGGQSLTLVAPLRRPLQVDAAIAKVERVCRTSRGKRCTAATKCSRKGACVYTRRARPESAVKDRRIKYGENVAIVGSLTDSAGSPIAGAPLAVIAQQRYGEKRRIGGVVTRSDGSYEFAIPDGPIRTFTVRFDGSATQAPAEATTRLRVRAAVSLKLSRTVVHSNQSVTFSGRIQSGSADLPPGGKVVLIQFYRAGAWEPSVGSPTTDAKGRFRVTRKWFEIAQPTTVNFHVRVQPEGFWPYESGSSDSVALKLRP